MAAGTESKGKKDGLFLEEAFILNNLQLKTGHWPLDTGH